ncbi:MAG: hypothetical protein D6769_01530 [Methanobacteriota archaeon]|nr:MAG: hypothetical protein D6769_01530 [Euryarchaeota archaeon]
MVNYLELESKLADGVDRENASKGINIATSFVSWLRSSGTDINEISHMRKETVKSIVEDFCARFKLSKDVFKLLLSAMFGSMDDVKEMEEKYCEFMRTKTREVETGQSSPTKKIKPKKTKTGA